jgi:hypothetical protein
MTAEALLATLRARGVEVLTDGQRVGVRPPGALSDDERKALRRLKPDVLALLVVPPRDYAHPWPDALATHGQRAVGPFDQCIDCGRGTWVRYGVVVLCLACARSRAIA